VVDDIEQNTELLSILLSRDQHTVTTASNGLEAIEAFNQQDFDVILMDIHMPECDGIELTRLENADDEAALTSVLADIKTELALIGQLLASTICKEPAKLIDNAEPLSTAELIEICQELYADAQNAELNDDLLDQLQRKCIASVQVDIDEIASAFDEFDFDNAQVKLANLLKKLTLKEN